MRDCEWIGGQIAVENVRRRVERREARRERLMSLLHLRRPEPRRVPVLVDFRRP